MKRRDFIRIGGTSGLAALVATRFGGAVTVARAPGAALDAALVDKFVSPIVKPPAFRPSRVGGRNYYAIAMRQFRQQILPPGNPLTTVWSYGPAGARTIDLAHRFFYPAFTLENDWRRPTIVKWVNGLVDEDGAPLPHLLPVDPTLHWANPIGERDLRPPADPRDPYWASPLIDDTGRYVGPVPMVTHVHGAHAGQESDGYPEAWYLPENTAGHRSRRGRLCSGGVRWAHGTYFDRFNPGDGSFGPGFATFSYPNDQRATTLWYHDHTLGMTRLNVNAGPAGFFLIRGGPDDVVRDRRDGSTAVLPGPAPDARLDPFGSYYEIPIAIQDRSFNDDGSLFYPDNRAFFELMAKADLQIPFFPNGACAGEPSDVAPIWNPEVFGNAIVVNGQTWPYLDTEQRRYRFRLLNGCQGRFLILDFTEITGVEVWQIGAEGGFLPRPVNVTAVQGNRLLMAPAERADVILDFTHVPQGDYVLRNLGPDEPFGGGALGIDFDAADPGTTGQILQFRVGPAHGHDGSTPPRFLELPRIERCDPGAVRQVSLNEKDSATVAVADGGFSTLVLDCSGAGAPFGPESALCGTVNADGSGNPLEWMHEVTESPAVGTCEEWEIHNFTEDAHPIHLHLVQFQVTGRQPMDAAIPTSLAGSNDPLPAERGFKDTVIAYPGEITKIRARFPIEGRYVWHCHIVEHEDNEMMRPFDVVRHPRPVHPPSRCYPKQGYEPPVPRRRRPRRKR